MRRVPVQILPALLLAFLLSTAFEAGASTVYVNRIITAEPGEVRVGDLVRVTGDAPPEARQILSQSVSTFSENPLYIPASSYRGLIEEGFGRDCITVGSRTLVLRRDSTAGGTAAFFDRMVDFLVQKGILADQRSELRFAQRQLTTSLPDGATPVFQILKNAHGAIELVYTNGGRTGESASGTIVLSIIGADLMDRGGVGVSDLVQVRFRKGPIEIEVQGRALSPAAVGERVSVYIADSMKSFAGTVAGRKAVEVEIP